MIQKTQIITNPSKKELKEHGSYQFPLLVSYEALSKYESGEFLWHWHSEVELTLIQKGSMVYQINDKVFHLSAGEALFGNSNTLHTGCMNGGEDCHYVSITFDPRLIYGYEQSMIQSKYVDPFITNTKLSAIHFDLSKEWHKKVIDAMHEICIANQKKYELYEIDIQVQLYHIWKLMFTYYKDSLEQSKKSDEKNYERIRRILFYMQENYASKIELEDIAKQINICKSECCRMFKKYMKESLFDYLIKYRIEQSLPHIIRGEQTVTEIALSVGFSDSNYFSKAFRKVKGCSPTKYKNQGKEEGENVSNYL